MVEIVLPVVSMKSMPQSRNKIEINLHEYLKELNKFEIIHFFQMGITFNEVLY